MGYKSERKNKTYKWLIGNENMFTKQIAAEWFFPLTFNHYNLVHLLQAWFGLFKENNRIQLLNNTIINNNTINKPWSHIIGQCP